MPPSSQRKDYPISGLALGISAGILLGVFLGHWLHERDWARIASAKHYSADELTAARQYDYAYALYPLGGAVAGGVFGAIVGLVTGAALMISLDRQEKACKCDS